MCLFIQQISPEHSSKPGIARCWDYRNNKAWSFLSRVANVQQPSMDAGMVVGADVQGDRGAWWTTVYGVTKNQTQLSE